MQAPGEAAAAAGAAADAAESWRPAAAAQIAPAGTGDREGRAWAGKVLHRVRRSQQAERQEPRRPLLLGSGGPALERWTYHRASWIMGITPQTLRQPES